MHTQTLLLALLTLTTSVLAQNRCQMFITHIPGTNPLFSKPDAGEITQGCKTSFADPDAAKINPPGCVTKGTFAVDLKKDIIVPKGVTGLPEDVLVHIFNSNLREGFVKYKAFDLNFENVNQCKTTEDGSLGSNVKFQRCEFDCP
jgi:hypothetical protein